jgi:hypothetical protein
LLQRPYCGNPFVAPGTIGSKSQHKTIQGLLDESYVFDDDTAMPRSDNSDQFSNHSSTTQDSPQKNKIFQNTDAVPASEINVVNEDKDKEHQMPFRVVEDNSKLVITKHRALCSKASELRTFKSFTFSTKTD